MPQDRRDELTARLANLQAVTDTALTRLDVEELLEELLARVRDVLDADTSAVLMLDPGSGDSVATAACGIEEEVRQGVRVPLGTGFAGRVAVTRGPIRLTRVDSTTVSNPILWEKGIRVMLGVPLLSGDRVLGVVHVGRLDDRPFDDDDVELLQVVAERLASATQTRQLAIERAAAGLLERSLLPGRLPALPGLEVSARYVAAAGRTVGGDWYDLFTVPSGRLWIVVGDVAGHGLRSAVVMGRIRSALRAYTLLGGEPEEVLELVDRKVNHFELGTIATVACAVAEPPFDALRVSLAGHLPPVVAVPGRPSVLAGIAVSPPLGIGWEVRRSSTEVDWEPGGVVAFYTDGLVERRGESIDVGLARLCDAVTPDRPDLVARQVLHKLVGHSTPEDDIALLVLRRTNGETGS